MLKLIYTLIRLSLGLVFVYSGLTKLIEPTVFAVLIDSYGILPEILVYPTAVILIVLEIIAGAGLIADFKGSLEIISCLLVIFIGVVSYGIFLGLDIDCGCFGKEEPEYKAYHGLRSALYRDIIMAAGILYLYIWRYFTSPELISLQTITHYFKKRSGTCI